MITLEIPSETERVLRLVAQQRGVALEEIVAERLNLSPQELEELEDEMDNAEAERRMANSDPAERKTLDDLRKAWKL
jgi:hypothetical protein